MARGSRFGRVGSIAARVCFCIVTFAALVIFGFNVYMHVSYSDFFENATAKMRIPGTAEGFVPQDLDAFDGGIWLFSGYMNDGTSSPIWRYEADGKASRINVELEGGSLYVGHGSGITHSDDSVLITCDDGYLVLPMSEVLSCPAGSSVKASAQVNLGFDPAFLNVEEGKLYAGTFHLEGSYDSHESLHVTTPDGTLNRAIMLSFERDADGLGGFSETPSAAFSLPDKVQGVVVVSDTAILSTSWGFSPSSLVSYRICFDGQTFETPLGQTVPLAIFDSTTEVAEIQGPPMCEGITLHDDSVFISEESASLKYLFGFLYGAGSVYSLPLTMFN